MMLPRKIPNLNQITLGFTRYAGLKKPNIKTNKERINKEINIKYELLKKTIASIKKTTEKTTEKLFSEGCFILIVEYSILLVATQKFDNRIKKL